MSKLPNETYGVVVCEVVAVLDALVTPHDVEEAVLRQKSWRHIRSEDAGETPGVRVPTLFALKQVTVKY